MSRYLKAFPYGDQSVVVVITDGGKFRIIRLKTNNEDDDSDVAELKPHYLMRGKTIANFQEIADLFAAIDSDLREEGLLDPVKPDAVHRKLLI